MYSSVIYEGVLPAGSSQLLKPLVRTSSVRPSGLVAVVTPLFARIVRSSAISGSSSSNMEPGAAVGVMRAPLATFGPTMNGWRGCCGAPTVVSVATTPSTSAAARAARKRRVEVTRDVRLVDCMTLHLHGSSVQVLIVCGRITLAVPDQIEIKSRPKICKDFKQMGVEILHSENHEFLAHRTGLT